MTETTPIYRIVDWDDRFENNRTRSLKRMQWVPIPNTFDGDRITELILQGGAGCYAAWVVIVLVASRCRQRGTLVRGNGKPHDARSLSHITRLDEETIRQALAVCLEVGLLETYEEAQPASEDPTPHPSAGIPQEGAGIRHPTDVQTAALENGMEKKGRERKPPQPPLAPDGSLAPPREAHAAPVARAPSPSARFSIDPNLVEHVYEAYPGAGRSKPLRDRREVENAIVTLTASGRFRSHALSAEYLRGQVERYAKCDKVQRGFVNGAADWFANGCYEAEASWNTGPPGSNVLDDAFWDQAKAQVATGGAA